MKPVVSFEAGLVPVRPDSVVDAHSASRTSAAAGTATRPAPSVQRRPAPAARPQRRLLTSARIAFLAVAALLAWGYSFPTEQYITPQRGVGYALGIAGGSLMLILLLYPLRKRLPALRFMGTTKLWFQTHMVLGVLGPVLILFHANFSLGATNSNVALVCMLVVSGSGLFGRYFYARIHHGLHGRKATLAELRDHAERLRHVSTDVTFLPELVSRVADAEAAIIAGSERTPLLARPFAAAAGVWVARRRLLGYVDRAMRAAATQTSVSKGRMRSLHDSAASYVDARLGATRRVVEFSAFDRLFSLWHALHMPLFVMLVIAGVVHVVAVHLY